MIDDLVNAWLLAFYSVLINKGNMYDNLKVMSHGIVRSKRQGYTASYSHVNKKKNTINLMRNRDYSPRDMSGSSNK